MAKVTEIFVLVVDDVEVKSSWDYKFLFECAKIFTSEKAKIEVERTTITKSTLWTNYSKNKGKMIG